MVSKLNLCRFQRFARADKRAKLPRWINQYITEAHANLSTDMAIGLSKLFIRSISQPFDHSITGVSLWTLEDIERRQEREKEEEMRMLMEVDGKAMNKKPMDADGNKEEGDSEEDEFALMGIDEAELMAMEMD